MIAGTTLAVLALPVVMGSLLGLVLRQVFQGRLRGFPSGLGCVVLPAAAVFWVGLRFPIVGVWDTLLESILVGVATLWTAHQVFGGSKERLLFAGAWVGSFILLEIACRLFLPPPPGFPTGNGIHLFLADAMHAESNLQHWDTLSKDVVCSIVYDTPGMFDPGMSRDIVTPRGFTERAGVTHRVLHVGDSMTFGFGVEREQTFVADLERAEPTVQHVNAAVPGIAPDSYYLLIRRWVATEHFDLVVMYVYEENDLQGLDSQFPCCNWQALLAYEGGSAQARCPQATEVDLGRAGWTWLRHESPPPYLARALIGWSSAAAYLSAALVVEPFFVVNQSTPQRLSHLELILRATLEELKAKGISFLVVVLPGRRWAEDPSYPDYAAPAILAAAQRVGVAAIDASTVIREAVASGTKIYMTNPENNDIHYNTTGHQIVANWLKDRYRQAVSWEK